MTGIDPLTAPPTRAAPASEARLQGHDGTVIPLDVGGWNAPANPVELRRLSGLLGPVLDIGCGPGRLLSALADRGVPSLGVDASAVAVDLARRRGTDALVRSVFDPIPGAGRWPTALLFDGNIGIGGDPSRLLRRVAEILAPDGRVVVEAATPHEPLRSFPAQVKRHGEISGWFPWAVIGVDALALTAQGAGFAVRSSVHDEGRWFLELARGS
jgi:SAM-dependent methyltransferase